MVQYEICDMFTCYVLLLLVTCYMAVLRVM